MYKLYIFLVFQTIMGTVSTENIFLLCFYAIMYRTTIVHNKILRIICSCLFFCLANIYRPSLGKVRLGRPNLKPLQPLNFYLRRKRKNPFYSELYALQVCDAAEPNFQFLFSFILKKIKNKFIKKNCQNSEQCI